MIRRMQRVNDPVQTHSRLGPASSAATYALAVLLLTSVHHAYGAHVYDTPWRYHAVLVSAVAALVILGAFALIRARPSGWSGALARGLLILTIVSVPVLTIGAFEGFYNHIVKNVLYFGGASGPLMAWLFPPPRYEMPNSLFFEITGLLQVVPAALAARHVYRMLRPVGTMLPRSRSRRGRVRPQTHLAERGLISISGEAVRIPDPERMVHLQFRRFAGCPICSLHLHTFARRRDEIDRAGIREVVVFHSTAEELLKYASELPFAIIADPNRQLYAEYGVEPSPRALLDPRVWPRIIRAVLHSLRGIIVERPAVPPINPAGGRFGLPADFLIGSDGRVLACKYGRHADDQWPVDELLDLARHGTTAGRTSLDEGTQGIPLPANGPRIAALRTTAPVNNRQEPTLAKRE